MKRYVLGFCFNPAGDKVVLIRKTRPDWQAGKLNGVGGHIEKGESPIEAMKREFKEETLWTEDCDWRPFGRLRGDGREVYLFHGCYDRIPSPFAVSDEGEASAHHVSIVLSNCTSKGSAPMPNLRYLIPMAWNHRKGFDKAAFFEVVETKAAA